MLPYSSANCPRLVDVLGVDNVRAGEFGREFFIEALHDLRVDVEIGVDVKTGFWVDHKPEFFETISIVSDPSEPLVYLIGDIGGGKFAFYSHVSVDEALQIETWVF